MVLKTSQQLKLAQFAAEPRCPGSLDQRSFHDPDARLRHRSLPAPRVLPVAPDP
jgi:hypothetical protein